MKKLDVLGACRRPRHNSFPACCGRPGVKFYVQPYNCRWPFREWNLSVGRLTVRAQMLRHDAYEDSDLVRFVVAPIILIWDSKEAPTQ